MIAQSESHIRRKKVGSPFPSSENNLNNQSICSKFFQKKMRLWLILCGRPNSQKLNSEGRTISQITQGLVDGSLRWENLLCGNSWWITYQWECMHFINGTWTQLQMDGSCLLLGFKIIITFEGQMTYGLSLLVFISCTIKTPLTSLSLVHRLCKCLLLFLVFIQSSLP